MKVAEIVVAILFCVIISGCSTTANFKIPEGSELYIYKRPQPVKVEANGSVTTAPFFWTAAGMPPNGGIPYSLEKNGETIKEADLELNLELYQFSGPPLQ